MQQQKQQQQQMLRTGGVLLLAGMHCVLPAGHFLSVSPAVIIAMVTVQVFSLVLSFTTSPFLDGQKSQKAKVETEQDAKVKKVQKVSKTADLPLELNAQTATLGFGCLLLLVVTTKVLSAVGLLDFERPVEGLLLAFLLGGVTRSVLADEAEEKKEADCCGACPTGESAPVDDEGCPYTEDFWSELAPAPAQSTEEEVDLSDLYEL